MTDFDSDLMGWNQMLPARQAQPSIQRDQSTHWTIVGAGFTGLACARRLAQLHPHEQILLLDARCIGLGASGRNSGFAVNVSRAGGFFDSDMRHQYQRLNRINIAGLELLRTQVQQHSIDCDWRESGFYHCAADKLSAREYHYFLDHLEKLDVENIVLDRDALNARLGTQHYLNGIHVPGGVLLQPASLVRGLADSLPENVSLHENTAVLSVRNNATIQLKTAHSSLTTDKLVLAGNYEIPRLGFLRNRLLGSTLSGSFTRILTTDELQSLGSEPDWGVLSLHNGGATVRLTVDHRLCIRNTAEYLGAKLMSEKLLQKRQAIHRVGFETRFPQLKHVPFEYAWSGVEGISRNGTQFFGEVSPGIYVAGGYNGSGVSRGTAFGHALAEYAGGGQSSLINDCLASPAAQWLPPRPLLDIAAMLTVKKRFYGVGQDR